jgi:hypothetical protein
MDKYDEYSRNAQVCVRMSKTTSNPDFKESWLKLAEAWMGMIPSQQSSMQFEDAAHTRGTGQKNSTSSH